jgi:hypothetical protein
MIIIFEFVTPICTFLVSVQGLKDDQAGLENEASNGHCFPRVLIAAMFILAVLTLGAAILGSANGCAQHAGLKLYTARTFLLLSWSRFIVSSAFSIGFCACLASRQNRQDVRKCCVARFCVWRKEKKGTSVYSIATWLAQNGVRSTEVGDGGIVASAELYDAQIPSQSAGLML